MAFKRESESREITKPANFVFGSEERGPELKELETL
jgi:hypothetical protein